MTETMLDFDIPLNRNKTTETVTVTETAPRVVETVRAIPNRETGHLSVPVAEWNWDHLRDYIMEEVVQRHGPQVRNAIKEQSICKSFITRWGIHGAVAIAKAAFEVHDGMWRNAPITIYRFTKGNDPYFAGPIAEKLGL